MRPVCGNQPSCHAKHTGSEAPGKYEIFQSLQATEDTIESEIQAHFDDYKISIHTKLQLVEQISTQVSLIHGTIYFEHWAMGTIINHIWHWKSILSVEGSSIKLLRSISIFSILSQSVFPFLDHSNRLSLMHWTSRFLINRIFYGH